MLDHFPEIRKKLEDAAAEHMEANRMRLRQVADVPVDQFLRQGLMEAQSLLILDLDNARAATVRARLRRRA